jgi:PRTRC genetic system protein C
MATITEIKRKVMFQGKQLTDIKELEIEQLKAHYSALYPELINAQISNLGIDQDGQMLYEFQLKVGTNG